MLNAIHCAMRPSQPSLKRASTSLTASLVLMALLWPVDSQAQASNTAAPSPKRASQTNASKAATDKAPGAAAGKADQPVRNAARRATAAAGAAAAAAAAVTALSAADDDQRQAFTLTHLGDHACEFKRTVLVAPHPVHEGYVDLHFDRRIITARPVLSSTGAIRLEDVRGQFVMLQIAFKSMLLDTRSGQRVADECLHARHHEARQAAAAAPAQPGLGIAAEPTR